MVGANSGSPHSPVSNIRNIRSAIESGQLPKDYRVLNSSPRLSYQYNSAIHFEATLSNQSSMCWESEKASCLSSILSTGTPALKSSAELVKEITTLEAEIIRLESYLLSLYRTAFEQHLPTSLDNYATPSKYKIGSQIRTISDQSYDNRKTNMQKCGFVYRDRITPANGLTGSDDQSHAATPKSSRKLQDMKNRGHRSLADHLGTSYIDILNSPAKLSEDIVRCISSMYCKLADPTLAQTGFSASSISSLSVSSSGTFSPRNISDSWSPRFNGEAPGHCRFQGLKDESGPYAEMTEVSKICLDDESFDYAAKMLQNFRSLVKSLEKVDPTKMTREEKLAFWINIHNALVMHAHLAYGTHTSVRSNSSLKAAYNVGGHCVNAYVIQSSILEIRSHHASPWLQTLLSPGKKFKAGSGRHVYAMEYPEPLVHFALCSGAFSDPAVRVYTTNNVFQDLKIAKEEFIQASVYIHKETKIYLPKILYYFAKDASLTMTGLVEMVSACLSAVQQKAIRSCIKGRPDKYVYWLPQSSTFRYVIHRDVAEGQLFV